MSAPKATDAPVTIGMLWALVRSAIPFGSDEVDPHRLLYHLKLMALGELVLCDDGYLRHVGDPAIERARAPAPGERE